MQEHIKKYLDVKKSGHNAVAKCPFHVDSSPSLYIYPHNYHCFACKAHGNVIDFEMHHKSLSFRDAVIELGRTYQIEITIENEHRSKKNLTDQTYLLKLAELQRNLKKDFSAIDDDPIKRFLKIHFSEVGYLESPEILESLNLRGFSGKEGKFYTFPYITERGEIFGLYCAQFNYESTLEIPIVIKSLIVLKTEEYQPIINLSQARKQNDDKILIIATNFLDFCVLLKNGIKNAVFLNETEISSKLYLYLAKFFKKIFILWPDNKKTPLFSSQISIFVRWIQSDPQQRIEFFRSLNSSNTLSWIQSAQRLNKKENLTSEKNHNSTKNKTEDTEMMLFAKTSDFYHRILLHESSAHVIKYLNSRGFDLSDIKKWKIGYCPRESILSRSLSRQKTKLDPFIRLGLIRMSERTKKYYDFFYGRFVIPIANHQGEYAAIGGRIFEEQHSKAPKYINSPESPFFSKSKILFNFYHAINDIIEQGYVIVVEGYMDCMTLVKYGIKNTVAVMGTALTSEHLKHLSQITQRIILCFDTDNAGQIAIKKSLMANFQNPSLVLETICLPSVKDPDEFIHKYGAKKFLDIIKNQTNMAYIHVIQSLQDASHDKEDFIQNLKNEFKYYEFKNDSKLYFEISDYLAQNYNISEKDIFTKQHTAPKDLSLTRTVQNHDAKSGENVPLWQVHTVLEIKILFAYFYSEFEHLPTKLKNYLFTPVPEESKKSIFYESFENHISDIGKQILRELFLYCSKNQYKGCFVLSEEELTHLTLPVKIFVAYLKKYGTILLNNGMGFLLDHTPSVRHNLAIPFVCEQVWSQRNDHFLRFQRKNVELAYEYGHLTRLLVENLSELEILEIDSQLAQYSRTHFDHELKEKFVYLLQERASLALLLLS